MHCCENEKGGKREKEGKAVPMAKVDKHTLVLLAMAVLLLGLAAFNQITLNELKGQIASLTFAAAPVTGGSGAPSPSASGGASGTPSGTASLEQVWNEIAPKGIPAVYGNELGVSYDDAEGAIAILSQYDDYPAYERKPVRLSEAANERYIAIATSISCEYCCGVGAIAAANGQPACGCAHSSAMRGLARYLLDTHPEMDDVQILMELSKWKVLFFPQNSVQKALALKANDLPTDYIALSSNIYRGIERQTAVSGSGLAQQVGGC